MFKVVFVSCCAFVSWQPLWFPPQTDHLRTQVYLYWILCGSCYFHWWRALSLIFPRPRRAFVDYFAAFSIFYKRRTWHRQGKTRWKHSRLAQVCSPTASLRCDLGNYPWRVQRCLEPKRNRLCWRIFERRQTRHSNIALELSSQLFRSKSAQGSLQGIVSAKSRLWIRIDQTHKLCQLQIQ